MFEHEYFDRIQFENIPLNRDCYLMDECYIPEYEASLLEVFEDKGGDPIGEIGFIAPRRINQNTLDLSWYPNIYSRFHELAISLPKDQFVACVGCERYDEKPHIFVNSKWLEQLYLKSYSVFCIVDAIGVKAALENGTLSRSKLILLREAIDRLADRHPDVFFLSFADNLLIKRNWTVGHFRSDVPYTYDPEAIVRIVKDIQAVYQEKLGLDVYAILAQGANEYYEDSLIHTSAGQNHVSLNSLGIPFAQLTAINASVRTAIREQTHGRFELYLDQHFYNSLNFRKGFDKQAQRRYNYPAPMMDTGSQYYCAQLRDVLHNSLDKKI